MISFIENQSFLGIIGIFAVIGVIIYALSNLVVDDEDELPFIVMLMFSPVIIGIIIGIWISQ